MWYDYNCILPLYIKIMKVLIGLLMITILLSSCEKESDYKYEVSGTSGNYSVTLQNTDDNTQQWSSVGTGWNYTWTQTGTRWLYISAQNNNGNGDVTVKIIKDGKTVSQNTGYGGYTIATASGDY